MELVLAAVHLDDEGHEEDGEDGARETSGLVAVPMKQKNLNLGINRNMTYFDLWYIKWYRESGTLDSFNNSKLKKNVKL